MNTEQMIEFVKAAICKGAPAIIGTPHQGSDAQLLRKHFPDATMTKIGDWGIKVHGRYLNGAL